MWRRLASEVMGSFNSFRVRRDSLESPASGRILDYDILEMDDWVQVVPFTPEGRLVMVEQFRPGTARRMLEFPAGFVDEGEEPRAAALRELEEETGHCASACELAGVLEPNGTLQTNRLWIYVARECAPEGEVDREEGEQDIRVRLVDPSQVMRLLQAGVIRDCITASVWCCYQAFAERGEPVGPGELLREREQG